MTDLIGSVKRLKSALDTMVENDPSLATSSGHPSRRTITEWINGVNVTIVFEYNFAGEVTVLSNYCNTDLWELESNDVRRQIEHACNLSLEQDGRL